MKLSARGLKKFYGNTLVLDLPEWEVGFQHCLALIGPSGSGKSTLLRLLAGLIAAEQGTLRVDNAEVPRDEKALLAYRRSLGVVFQAFNLFPHLNALENVMLPLEHAHGVARPQARRLAMEWLERFGLGPHAMMRPAQLSGGQRQRVAIARAAAVKPRMLLLDEPTSALDPEMTAEVLDLLQELRHQETPLVLVTHEMGFARQAADVVVFLEAGKVSGQAPAAEFFASPPCTSARAFLEHTLRFAIAPPLPASSEGSAVHGSASAC